MALFYSLGEENLVEYFQVEIPSDIKPFNEDYSDTNSVSGWIGKNGNFSFYSNSAAPAECPNLSSYGMQLSDSSWVSALSFNGKKRNLNQTVEGQLTSRNHTFFVVCTPSPLTSATAAGASPSKSSCIFSFGYHNIWFGFSSIGGDALSTADYRFCYVNNNDITNSDNLDIDSIYLGNPYVFGNDPATPGGANISGIPCLIAAEFSDINKTGKIWYNGSCVVQGSFSGVDKVGYPRFAYGDTFYSTFNGMMVEFWWYNKVLPASFFNSKAFELETKYQLEHNTFKLIPGGRSLMGVGL